jgi:hypothetical protein
MSRTPPNLKKSGTTDAKHPQMKDEFAVFQRKQPGMQGTNVPEHKKAGDHMHGGGQQTESEALQRCPGLHALFWDVPDHRVQSGTVWCNPGRFCPWCKPTVSLIDANIWQF